ncbi:MAG: PBP1A family penicillin-binding protein [Bryobacteraceae bacterium]
MAQRDPFASNPKKKTPLAVRISQLVLVHPVGRAVLAVSVFGFATIFFSFVYFYSHYANLVEEKLLRGPYATTSQLFGAPQVINLGDEVSSADIIAALHRSGYSENRANRMGWYQRRDDGIEVFPGSDSYFQQEAHVLRFDGRRVAQIISLRDNTERTQFWLEPELITNLFDRNREKRRIMSFQDIPPVMKNAVLSAEDKRFFSHSGFDPVRVLKSAWVDLKAGKNVQGASTLSMQVARMLLLTNERSWRRKIPEILITIHLERKLSKEEVFEHYCNQIYIGRVGSFNIHGFGEGAQAYFGKDIRQLTLPEAATLAGLVQGPSIYNPFKSPEKAKARRNTILIMMRENGYISEEQYQDAIKAPLGIAQGGTESEDAPYFVDLVNDELQAKFQDHDFQANSYRVYTSLDINLQKAAAEAMKAGLKEVDTILEKKGRTAAKGWPQVQAALVALDPQTGEVKALIGGRDYGTSQLNRTLSKRMPGSIFKPFVYAAALATGLEGGPNSLTPASTVSDEPTTFWFDGKPYEPNNYHNQFNGTVTMRQALLRSMNVPTVKFAEKIGYGTVAAYARRAGLTGVGATPAAALGSYDARPLDMAGAYTVFAARGIYSQPNWVKMIRDQEGKVIFSGKPVRRQAIDPRVAYMMVNLMEGVINSGTGAGVRGRGFSLPVAGKTGTSHDGWFAGFTSELLCVVWVGYDDNRDLELDGARAALPVWTEFMKRAHKFRPYRRASAFSAPDGVVSVDIDSASGKLAGGCGGQIRPEVFLVGTQPLETCGGGGGTQVASWDAPEPSQGGGSSEPRRVASRQVTSIPVSPQPVRSEEPAQQQQQAPKKGLLDRIIGVFR